MRPMNAPVPIEEKLKKELPLEEYKAPRTYKSFPKSIPPLSIPAPLPPPAPVKSVDTMDILVKVGGLLGGLVSLGNVVEKIIKLIKRRE